MSTKYKVVGRKKVKFADLKTNLFVRHHLDQDHALYLAELIENGVKLPAIKVTSETFWSTDDIVSKVTASTVSKKV